MWKSVFCFLCLLSFSCLSAQPPEKNIAPTFLQIDYKASEKPDRILLSWEKNELSTQTVTWRTIRTTSPGVAEISRVTKTFDFYENPRKFIADTVNFDAIDEEVTYHKVTFDGLLPNLEYAYRVGQGEYWSEWIQFRTPPAEPTSAYSFIYLGDAQNDLFPLWSRVIREAYKKAPHSGFILHAGDLINHSQNNYEWGEWFAGGSHILRMVPQIITPGNHEYVKDEAGVKLGLSPIYNPQFNFPSNGIPKLADTNYFIDYLNCKVISLNSNEQIEEQAKWLEEVLRQNDKKWTIVTFHHPIISGAMGRINEGIVKDWKPILDKYKVDLVLQGHDHVYGRGNNVQSGLNQWDEDSGTVYVVSVSGRKMYPLSNHSWMQKKAENIQLYQIITIEDNKLIYKAYTTDNELFDGFKLLKRKKNKLVELKKD